MINLWRAHYHWRGDISCPRCTTTSKEHWCDLCECPLCANQKPIVYEGSPFRGSVPTSIPTQTSKVEKIEAGILVEKYRVDILRLLKAHEK